MRLLRATLACLLLVACKEPGQAPVIAVPPSENTLVGTADGRAFAAKSVAIRFEEGGRTVEIFDFSTGCALGTSFDESPPGSRRLTLRFAKDAWHPGFDEALPSARTSAELAIRRGDKGVEKRAIVSGHVRVLLPYYRDVFDHFARVTSRATSYDDVVTNTLAAYLSVQSNRMNETVKTLTLMSTFMLPLSFIASVYGMNFRAMPETQWQHGYLYVLSLMATVALSILFFFKRKGWL